MNRFVFTSGDINGIGPEIAIKVFNVIFPSQKQKIIYVSPSNIFLKSIENIKPGFEFEFVKPNLPVDSNPKKISVIDLGEVTADIGKPTKISGEASIAAIKTGFDLVSQNKESALITNPISKHAFQLAGIDFPGHTELLAEWSGVNNFAMMFLSEEMKCALATIHEPLNKVPGLISREALVKKIRLIYDSLRFDFGIGNSKIAVLGLNPHAGEEGMIGSEETEIIKPAMKDLNRNNFEGPFVPDAFFANKKYLDYDVVFGMYHDQVLIPFKMLNFNSGVNFTAGLPIVRTSPDHGTAFDIAGKNKADYGSLLAAFYWAEKILNKRNSN